MALLQVYLDTCILSRIPDLRVSESTAAAYADIAKSRQLQLVTSDKSFAEVLQTVNPVKNSMLQFLVALVEKVPVRILEMSGAIGGAPIGALAIGESWTDPLFTGLAAIFDRDDAEHVVHATKAGCRYFLTLDEATILSRVRSNSDLVASLCGELEFVNPVELASRLQRA